MFSGVEPDTYHVFIKKSKVDQDSLGATVVVSARTSSGSLCLKRQLKLFSKVFAAMGITTDVLFGSMDDPSQQLN